jgi:hypothetical protein
VQLGVPPGPAVAVLAGAVFAAVAVVRALPRPGALLDRRPRDAVGTR